MCQTRLRVQQCQTCQPGDHHPARRPRLLDMADLPEGLPGLAAEQALLVVCSTQVWPPPNTCIPEGW